MKKICVVVGISVFVVIFLVVLFVSEKFYDFVFKCVDYVFEILVDK